MTSLPPVSIGVPVFNGGATIVSAIESLLSQTHADLEIIISDNGSTDDTPELCAAIAASDSRVRLVRQLSNKGADANFGFVLDAATHDYFMWAAADDTWERDFVARNVGFLESHTGHVASISRVVFRPGMSDEAIGATSLECADPTSRVRRFLQHPGANSRFYSVFRTAALREACRIPGCFLARDWAIIVALLLKGKMHVLDGDPLMQRGYGGVSADAVQLFRSMRGHAVERVVPLLPFSREVLRLTGWRPRIIGALVRLNLLALRNFLRARATQRGGTR